MTDEKEDNSVVIEKTVENVADEIPGHEPEVQSPVTPDGQPVEDQVRKEWQPNKDGGLPTFFPTGTASSYTRSVGASYSSAGNVPP